MLDNGARVDGLKSVAQFYLSTFLIACRKMDVAFVKALAGKIPAAHIHMTGWNGQGPLYSALNHICKDDLECVEMMMLLITLKVPVRACDFPSRHLRDPFDAQTHMLNLTARENRRKLLSLAVNAALDDHNTFTDLILKGVHGRTPSRTGTPRRFTTKTVFTQQSDGTFLCKSINCNPRTIIEWSNVNPAENHLVKIRGHGNTRVRQALAQYIGAPIGHVKKLQVAQAVLLSVFAEEKAVAHERRVEVIRRKTVRLTAAMQEAFNQLAPAQEAANCAAIAMKTSCRPCRGCLATQTTCKVDSPKLGKRLPPLRASAAQSHLGLRKGKPPPKGGPFWYLPGFLLKNKNPLSKIPLWPGAPGKTPRAFPPGEPPLENPFFFFIPP
eukprot:FR742790.1.p1 GENE.FR742790.1~~FR742790.1.p1  ORF type:complete len:391 (+),score=80.36 FR742790.1:25-1173(+)